MKRLILLLLPIGLFAGYIHNHLAEKLVSLNDNESIRVVVYLSQQADCSGFPESAYEEKIEYIKWVAQTSQAPIVNWLMSRYPIPDLQQFSVVNAFACTLPKWLIVELSQRPDVGFVIDDYKMQLIPPNETRYILDYFNPGEDYIGWDQVIINAHQVWNLGFKGNGIVIGNMDTGVDWSHPRLRDSYRGISAWYNSMGYGSATIPFDDNGHGTGTMGFLVANYGIGTAPNAKWIAVKIMDSLGNGSVSQIVDGFNWVFNLPDSLRPKVMSNSWGASSGNDTLFWTCCLNWKNAGILPVFSAGNSGPSANSIGRPARLPTTLAVGATDPYDRILDYSSRGPAPNVSPINNSTYWYRSDWNRHKPDIAAPADPTTTTAPGAQYQGFGGTSAASPHAAGVAGLLLSKNPNLTPTNLYNIITDYAALVYPSSYNYPNDTFGWGRVDAFKAIQNTPAPTTPNLFVSAVKCTLDNDGDNELDPGERTRLKLWIKNLSSVAATGCSLKIWEENTNISLETDKATLGTINPGQEVVDWTVQIRATTFLPETSYVYFKVKIYADGGYVKHDYFNIYVPMQPNFSFRDTLIKDNGSAAYTADVSAWFAAQFVATGPCSVLRVINMTYLGSSTCSLAVWLDNNDKPGTKLYQEPYTAGASLAWQDESLNARPYIPPGKFWVGYWMSNNPTQELEDGNGASGPNLYSTDGGNTWSDSYWYDFMIRPVVKYNYITAPVLAYGSYKIDDSEFGNNDGYLDPGERVKISVGLKNYGVVCHNVTGKLRAGDATTAARITILDSTANFGTVHNGEDGGSNAQDPFLIQMFDESPLEGWDPNFKLVLNGNYGANNGSTYNDSFNFTIAGPWIPDVADTLFYPLGGDGLWIGYNNANTWFWATHAVFATDSIYVDSVAVYVYDDNGAQTISLPVRIWNVGANGYPGTTIWTGNTNAVIRGWAWARPNRKIPGEFYIGFRNVWSGLSRNYIIIWGDYFIGDNTYVDADNNWASGPDVGYIGAPLAFYLKINDQSPALSYYAPAGWTWPIIPSNSEARDTVLDQTLIARDSTYLTDWVCLNRSSKKAGPISGGFDNYLFLDNWGVAYSSVDSLLGWYYTAAYLTDKIYIPGGRHTLLSYLDWNDEVRANIFNYYLRIWGQQYVWTPESNPLAWTAWKSDYAPDYTGMGAGPYYNCNAWRVWSWGNRWQGIGIRPNRFSSSGDSIDIDLRLYSDTTTGPNAGLTQVLEASCLGPGKVDFVVWNGRKVGTTYFPGVYSFGAANDSFYINFYPSRFYLEAPFTNTFSYLMDPSIPPIHVYDLILGSGVTYQPNLTPASGLDLGIGLYNSIGNDHILSRTDAIVWADANGPGGVENFSYTNNKPVADTYAVVIWNNGGSGIYTLRGTGVTIDIEEDESPLNNLPGRFALQTYPNPAAGQIEIKYAVPHSSRINLSLYDVCGRLVQILVDKEHKPGFYEIKIKEKKLASGVYFCQMKAENFDEVKKIILVR